jgi:hypothetical protein
MIESAQNFQNDGVSRRTDEFLRICRSAVRNAQERNRRLGIANAYSINGRLYYELPNGELSLVAPEPKAIPDKPPERDR